MSQPPELPGTRRLKRAAASAGGSAYQGVFEAVGAILIACVAGFWIDRKFETAPVGILVGAAIGFGAFVLRLMRLGKELHPDGEAGRAASGADVASMIEIESDESMAHEADERAIGDSAGLSDLLREDGVGSGGGDKTNSSDRDR